MNAVATVLSFQKSALTLVSACAALEAAKAAENDAGAARLAAESAVIALVGELPVEGTTRHEAGEFVAVVQTSVRRTVDSDALRVVSKDIPDAIGLRLIRWKAELDIRELRYVMANEPEIYRLVSTAIETKPAKPSVKIERAKVQA